MTTHERLKSPEYRAEQGEFTKGSSSTSEARGIQLSQKPFTHNDASDFSMQIENTNGNAERAAVQNNAEQFLKTLDKDVSGDKHEIIASYNLQKCRDVIRRVKQQIRDETVKAQEFRQQLELTPRSQAQPEQHSTEIQEQLIQSHKQSAALEEQIAQAQKKSTELREHLAQSEQLSAKLEKLLGQPEQYGAKSENELKAQLKDSNRNVRDQKRELQQSEEHTNIVSQYLEHSEKRSQDLQVLLESEQKTASLKQQLEELRGYKQLLKKDLENTRDIQASLVRCHDISSHFDATFTHWEQDQHTRLDTLSAVSDRIKKGGNVWQDHQDKLYNDTLNAYLASQATIDPREMTYKKNDVPGRTVVIRSAQEVEQEATAIFEKTAASKKGKARASDMPNSQERGDDSYASFYKQAQSDPHNADIMRAIKSNTEKLTELHRQMHEKLQDPSLEMSDDFTRQFIRSSEKLHANREALLNFVGREKLKHDEETKRTAIEALSQKYRSAIEKHREATASWHNMGQVAVTTGGKALLGGVGVFGISVGVSAFNAYLSKFVKG